jgi:hypothetical protein
MLAVDGLFYGDLLSLGTEYFTITGILACLFR